MLQASATYTVSTEIGETTSSSSRTAPFVSYKESQVLRALKSSPLTIEDLAARSLTNQPMTRILVKRLVEKGFARVFGDGRYALVATGEKTRAVTVSTERLGDVNLGIGKAKISLLVGDAEDRLRALADESVDVIVTSPPYYKERNYWSRGQTGWEPTPDAFVARIVDILAQCSRVLTRHGLMFLDFDDQVVDGKLACIDAKIAVRLDEAGFEKHREIIWRKINPAPSGTDNALAHSYEKIFVLRPKGGAHYWDFYASRQDAKTGGMKRLDDVWEIAVASSHPLKGAHNALFPVELVRRCLDVATSEGGYCPRCHAPWTRIIERGETTWKKAGASNPRSRLHAIRRGKADFIDVIDVNGKSVKKKMADMKHVGWEPSCSHGKRPVKAMILDPFVGGGTTGLVAAERGCGFTGIDINRGNVAFAAEALAEHGG